MKIEDAILDPSKIIQGNPNILSRLYWRTIKESRINIRTFNSLSDKYGSVFNVPSARTKGAEAVNNLKSVLVRRNLTWVQFLRGLYLIGGTRVIITLDLTRGSRAKPMVVQAELQLTMDIVGNRRGTVSTKIGTIQDALSSPLAHARKASGVLAYLFWLTFYQYDIPHHTWLELVRKYTLNPYNVPDQTAARRNEAKNNLISTLLNNTVSWSQFLRGMRLLDIRTMGITIELYRGDDMIKATDSCDFKPFIFGDQHGHS